jgi:adenylosuccinate lyase
MKSGVAKQPFKEALLKDKTIREKLSEKEIDYALNPRNYLGTAKKQIELAVKRTEEERKNRGLETRQ